MEKRIDVIATAIKGKLKVSDLTDLELAYAPPYSSAKDPVNMAGYVATNVMDEEVSVFQYHEVEDLLDQGALLVDVREPHERINGAIKGSINIPLGEIRERLIELPKDQIIYVHCQVGLRGYLATRVLKNNGYETSNLSGGYKTYESALKA